MSFEKKLTLAAVVTLLALGVVSLYGIVDYAIKTRSEPNFIYSEGYLSFMHKMDKIAFPFAVLFILILAACIPKRLLPERLLLRLMGTMLFFAMLISIHDYRLSLGLVLVFAAALQAAVLILTLSGRELNFLSTGYKKRVGSALMHLGIVVIALSIVQPSWVLLNPLTVFWGATLAVGAGMLLLFYTGRGEND